MSDGASPSHQTRETSPLVALLVNTTVTLLLLTAMYFTLPFQLGRQAQEGWVRAAVSVLLFVGLVLAFRSHVRRTRAREGALVRIEWLLAALYVLVLAFALAYAVTAHVSEHQFTGLHTRTDSLYFSVTLVSTVGLGDIHPAASFAKLLATTQMVVDLVYIGTSVRLLGSVHDPRGGTG